MKLSLINKKINPIWLKPIEANIKVGSVIKYKRTSGEDRFCKVKRIETIYGIKYWGHFVYFLKDINETGNETNLSFDEIEWVLK